MNMSRSKELQYYVFHYSSIFNKKNKRKMTINLTSIFRRNYRLGLLEMVFQDINISKFSGGACPQTPLVKYRLGQVLRLDSLLNAGIGLVKTLKCKIFLGKYAAKASKCKLILHF